MSRSTMTRTTHVLTKYSKSVNNTLLPQKSGDLRWKDYTEPYLQILLEISRSPSNELESVRLRVVWSTIPKGKTNLENEILVSAAKHSSIHVREIPLLGGHRPFIFRESTKSVSVPTPSSQSCISRLHGRIQIS